MQKQLTQIPSVLASLNLPATVEISEQIYPQEGTVILVEGDVLPMTPVLPGTRKSFHGRTELISL